MAVACLAVCKAGTRYHATGAAFRTRQQRRGGRAARCGRTAAPSEAVANADLRADKVQDLIRSGLDEGATLMLNAILGAL